MTTTTISSDKLQTWVSALFQAMDVSPESADATAESLVDADLRGIVTHGVVRVPIYVKRLSLGLINPQPEARFTSLGAAERMDGDNGLGQWVGLQAMMRACDLAEKSGVGLIVATRSNHFGTAGWFARKAAERGFAALIWSQGDALVVPYGGTKRFCGTNPFCMSMPWEGEEPITLDMATSAVAFGKIETAKVTTGVIPADWAVDADGKPTTDPYQVHALQPMAGPKGSGLALLIDLMSGALAGGACGPRIHRMYDDFENAHDLAHTFIAIRADAFAEGRTADAVVTEAVADFRSQPPAEGFDGVLLPGEMEARKAAAAEKNGIALPATLAESLRGLGTQYGKEFPA